MCCREQASALAPPNPRRTVSAASGWADHRDPPRCTPAARIADTRQAARGHEFSAQFPRRSWLINHRRYQFWQASPFQATCMVAGTIGISPFGEGRARIAQDFLQEGHHVPRHRIPLGEKFKTVPTAIRAPAHVHFSERSGRMGQEREPVRKRSRLPRVARRCGRAHAGPAAAPYLSDRFPGLPEHPLDTRGAR